MRIKIKHFLPIKQDLLKKKKNSNRDLCLQVKRCKKLRKKKKRFNKNYWSDMKSLCIFTAVNNISTGSSSAFIRRNW